MNFWKLIRIDTEAVEFSLNFAKLSNQRDRSIWIYRNRSLWIFLMPLNENDYVMKFLSWGDGKCLEISFSTICTRSLGPKSMLHGKAPSIFVKKGYITFLFYRSLKSSGIGALIVCKSRCKWVKLSRVFLFEEISLKDFVVGASLVYTLFMGLPLEQIKKKRLSSISFFTSMF